eukprot:9098597-Pyramimonas_sp.AAC.1
MVPIAGPTRLPSAAPPAGEGGRSCLWRPIWSGPTHSRPPTAWGGGPMPSDPRRGRRGYKVSCTHPRAQ